jgi:hypothetical protein
MPMRTGRITAVLPEKGIYAEPEWFAKRTRVGTRYGFQIQGVPVYTRDELRASWCLAAKQDQRLVTIGTRDTQWGETIVSLAYAEEGEAA